MDQLYSLAHKFDPRSLTVAREFRGLQKKDLATTLNVTPSAISQLEAGRVKITPKMLANLSLALNFPPSFFGQPVEGEMGSDRYHFRSLRSSSQQERRCMVSASILIERLVEWISQRVELPPEKIDGSGPESVKSTEIEDIAAKVRLDWNLGQGPIPDLIKLLESRGILPFRVLSTCRRVDAFSVWRNGRPLVFLSTEKGLGSRSRFDAAHELGHLVMHADCVPGDPDQEAEANRFASAFLMPRESFQVEFPHRLVWPHLFELKERWRVSLAAIVRRAFDLKKISRATYTRANVYLRTRFPHGEPHEPAIEHPSVVPAALELLKENGWPFEKVAGELCLREADLKRLVYADSAED